MENPSNHSHSSQAVPDYQAFDQYYSLRSKVLGLQSGAGTPVYRLIRRELASAQSIIDVGCGRGMYLTPLSAEGHHIRGFDFNASNVELLTRRGYSATQCDCVAGLPPEAAGADAAICAEVVEHLNGDQARSLLRNIHSALSEKGVLIVTVPYREDLKRNICVCPACGLHFHRDGHVRAYAGADELIRQATEAGFTLIHDYVIYPQLAAFRITPFFIYLLFSRIRPEKQGTLIGVFRR